MTFPILTVFVFVIISLWLMVVVVRSKGRELKVRSELKELERLYSLMMTTEGHLQIAREELRLLRANEVEDGKAAFDLLHLHLRAAGASLEDIGTDFDEL